MTTMNGNGIDDATPVFYVPGRFGIVDTCIERDGVMVSAINGETLEQIRLRYPGAELGALGPVCEHADEAWKVAPVEITQERFWEMLEVLPPVGWKRDGDCESFKLSERTSGNITAIFARIGERYFEMQDSIFTPHAKIMEACKLVSCAC